jgi:murein L,D-transpeptidase YcbB/YkuD
MSRTVLSGSRCAFIMLLLLAAGACSRGDDAVGAEIRKLVSAAKPPAEAKGVRWKVVKQVYGDRKHRPLWTAGGRPSRAARSLVATLCDAEREGLRPADYDLADLRKVLERTYAGDKRTTPAALAALDLELTARFLEYGADLLAGRLDPAAVDDGWYIRARRSSVDSTLRAALRENGLDDMLDPLRPRQKEYADLVEALEEQRKVLDDGGWPVVPAGGKLRRGDRGGRVAALRTRLRMSRDLDGGAGAKAVYDDRLAAAVARFQDRHGIPVDSAVGPATLVALNVPVEIRIRQIELNLERYRWLPSEFGRRYVLVNIPDYRLYAYDGGKERLTMRVIVGDEYGNATPVFADSMTYLVFRPHWYVPEQILVDEVIPRARENTYYLAQHRFEVVDARRQSVVLDPKSIDWSDVDTADLAFRVRQKAGDDNSLGLVKFMFPNRFSVYLHDTPAHALFDQSKRALSHGCIRVEKPVELAEYVLDGQRNWNTKRIREAMGSVDTAGPVPADAGGAGSAEGSTVRLERPVPVYIVYLTAFVRDGVLNFRDDPYAKDRQALARLGKPRPRDHATCAELVKLLGG